MSHFPQYVSPEYKTMPLQAVAAGKTGKPETLPAPGGATASAGKIVFTNNLIAGDTVSLGGVVVATAVASGAVAGVSFVPGGTLSLSLDALVTMMNASTDPVVSLFTWTKTDANTALTGTPDGDGAGCNAAFASNHSTVVLTQPAGGVDRPVVSLDTETSVFNTATAGNATLPAGDEGQDKNIVNLGAGAIAVKGTFTGGNSCAMPQNSAVSLTWLGNKWRVAANDGATIS
jgi:hypothetical protein